MLNTVVKCETCKHFLGCIGENAMPYCKAFPSGIPGLIFAEYKEHNSPQKNEVKNGIVYEKK